MLRLDISERLELRDSVVGNLRISGPGIRTGYYTGISGRKLVHGVSVVKIENKVKKDVSVAIGTVAVRLEPEWKSESRTWERVTVIVDRDKRVCG